MSDKILCLSIWIVLFAAPGLHADDRAAKYSAFLDALERVQEDKLLDIQIEELRAYLSEYPNAANRAEMHSRIASIFNERGNEEAAFLAYLEIVYLYPGSDEHEAAKDGLRILIMNEGKFESLRAKIDDVLTPSLPDTTPETAAYLLIRDLLAYELEPLNGLLIESCSNFRVRFPDSPRNDEVLYWKARLFARDDQEERALATYMKVSFIYDRSLYASSSKLKMAELYTDHLKMHQNAILTLEEFLLEFPEDPQAPYAQMRLAQILEKKEKSPLDAIEAYVAVAQKYPQSLEAVPALFEAARLYEKEFKEYDQAIRIYTEVVRDFPQDLKAPFAMVEAARIYEDKLEDYHNAASVYFKIYGSYPESSIAVESLYAAAEINEKKIQDHERALTYYRLIVDNYPTHKLALKASKQIQKISRELR